MSLKMRLIPIVLFACYGLYYYVSNQEIVPITGRAQLVEIDRQQEVALGVQSYQQILSESQVVSQGEAVDLVRRIGQQLAKAAVDVDPGFQWEFNVINSEQANAFALPGGKTAVYTGLLPVAENADGLAVVMGHEIAHAIARHGAERMAGPSKTYANRIHGSQRGIGRYGLRYPTNGLGDPGSRSPIWHYASIFPRS